MSNRKLHVLSGSYCAILAALNWFYNLNYLDADGVGKNLSPVMLAGLLSGVMMIFLVIRCILEAKARLEDGIKIQPGRWIRSWSVLLYALPLLVRYQVTDTWRGVDGMTVASTAGYGHGLSSWVFLFAVSGLLLFQLSMRLSSSEVKTGLNAGREAR